MFCEVSFSDFGTVGGSLLVLGQVAFGRFAQPCITLAKQTA